MQGVACQLADVINVINTCFEGASHVGWSRLSSHPARNHHPCIQGSTYYSTFFYQSFELFVTKLAVVVYNGPAVVVTRPNRPFIKFHCIPESIIAQMGCIEDHI